MDVQKTAREIGLFETAVNLAKVSSSPDVLEKIGNTFPIPMENISDNMSLIADWLLSFGKSKYMFFTPEIALAEIIGEKCPSVEIIFAVPCDMDPEAKERLTNNLPRHISVNVFEEPYFPQNFFPANTMFVVCGYSGADRMMVFPDTYRMVEHYNVFKGKKVFVPYIELEGAHRYDGWMELNAQRINMKWRKENEQCCSE